MRIDFHGRPVDEPEVRAGFIGCGSHAFRNILPTFQFAPVKLVATCDLDIEKAKAFASKFGARAAYADYHEMLDREELDAVFVVTGYDKKGRPVYPRIAVDCLGDATSPGPHVWIEKPPAASCDEIDAVREAAAKAGRNVLVGFKKMFMPANEKAKGLCCDRSPALPAPSPPFSGYGGEAGRLRRSRTDLIDDFGRLSLATFRYPQRIPTLDELARYANGENVGAAVGFLDHLCHPASLMVYLMGMPRSLYYERSASGAGVATFTFDSGAVATLALTHGAARGGGMERTTLVSDSGREIVVENNVRVTYRRDPPRGYGDAPDFFTGSPDENPAAWEPEFSLGQLYNKGLFLLGYYGEVNEFARSVLEARPPAKGTLDEARQVTRIFEAFAGGPGKTIAL